MRSGNEPTYDAVRRLFSVYLAVLLILVFALGLLHWFLGDLRAGGVTWFNLDKERNIPTWFSGMLFFLFGCSAIVAYWWEKHRNASGQPCFRLPVLWFPVAMFGLYVSLDETTILHENIYWREIRRLSGGFGDAWKYMTQWQILFGPAAVAILCYFILFFNNRFKDSRDSRISAYAGVGCWLVALSIEGIRETFLRLGPAWYSLSVLFEEMLEMNGTIFLMAAITFYVIDIALDFSETRRERFLNASRFLTKRTMAGITAVVCLLSAAAGTIYYFAQRQASLNAPLPRLYLKANRPARKVSNRAHQGIVAGTGADTSPVRFGDIKKPVPVSDPIGKALLQAVDKTLFREPKHRTAFTGKYSNPPTPSMVFLSIGDGISPAQVVMATGRGIGQAVSHALDRLDRRLDHRFRSTPESRWIKLDVVQEVIPINPEAVMGPLVPDRSLFGLVFPGKPDIAFLPDELTSQRLVDSKGQIKPKHIMRYLRQRDGGTGRWPDLKAKQRLYRFSTTAFFTDGNGFHRLYRGHRIFGQVSDDRLLSAAKEGGDYLVRAVLPDGKFIYSYFPKTDRISPKYNLVRHAGTLYAMVELYEITKDAGLLRAIDRAIGYLLKHIKTCTIGNASARCVVGKDFTTLGANALTAVALAKYTEVTRDRRHVGTLVDLGKWIRHAQAASGEFVVQKQRFSDGRIIDVDSRYYPGEAILALLRIHRIKPSGDLLDAAEKGAEYLITVRDAGLAASSLIHDHWLLYALNELHRRRPTPLYIDHAMRIARAIVDSQNLDPKYPDWRGSYYRPPRSTPTATRSEGLNAAYRLARDFGLQDDADKFLRAIRQGVLFQLQTQIRPESALYLKNPRRALGGFKRSLTNFEIRIDYVQHNISSLLGFYRILGHRN